MARIAIAHLRAACIWRWRHQLRAACWRISGVWYLGSYRKHESVSGEAAALIISAAKASYQAAWQRCSSIFGMAAACAASSAASASAAAAHSVWRHQHRITSSAQWQQHLLYLGMALAYGGINNPARSAWHHHQRGIAAASLRAAASSWHVSSIFVRISARWHRRHGASRQLISIARTL